MSSYEGVLVSDPWLQSQFTQVELRGLKTKFHSLKVEADKVMVKRLPPLIQKLKGLDRVVTEQEIAEMLEESYPDTSDEIDFETFLRAYLDLRAKVGARQGDASHSSSFLQASTTTLLHTVNESEKASYVSHINSYLAEDPFLQQFLPLDPATNDLFDLVRDGVLLCKLINVAVPGTVDERAINAKPVLNPWERNENHTLCLNSAKAIGCTVVNIGTQDLIEGRPHLVLGLISQIIKIQLLANLNLKKTPQLMELVDDGKDAEELLTLAPEKMLLKWMNFHLKKAGYEKTVTNFSSDVKDAVAYAYLLHALAPEHCTTATVEIKYPIERAKRVIEESEKLGCKRYISPRDIVDGSPNLNLAFVAQIFQLRSGLSNSQASASASDDILVAREERAFRLWINSLGVSTYVNNLFEDVKNGWVLLEVLDKVSPGLVNWKQATKPPIEMPFRKLENCNQVIDIGREKMNFSLVNVDGNDIMQGNKKLLLAYLWQLMRFNILELLNNLRTHSQGKTITDVDILNWANETVKESGGSWQMESFKDKSLSNGMFFLELLSAVKPRAVSWKLVTKGETDDERKMNATYVISIARKLGCSVYLLPEDISEVNQKMTLALTATIMYWSLKHAGASSVKAEPPAEVSVVSTTGSAEDDGALPQTPEVATD